MIGAQTVTVPGASVASTGTVAQAGSNTLSKDDFLRLLVTQLQHQDPLNPLDENQFLSQTAQFTALEQLQNINTALGDLTAQTASSSLAQSAALLGKTVKVAGSDFAFDGSTAVSLPFTVEGSAAPVHVDILDQQGNLVRGLDVNATAPGAYAARWDGLDSAGRRMLGGSYYYRVSALSGTSGSNAVAAAAQGVLTGFEVTGGALRYRLGSALVRPEDVIDVRQ
jgi:flagellar basal-body rod modification protein FlgD